MPTRRQSGATSDSKVKVSLGNGWRVSGRNWRAYSWRSPRLLPGGAIISWFSKQTQNLARVITSGAPECVLCDPQGKRSPFGRAGLPGPLALTHQPAGERLPGQENWVLLGGNGTD